MFNRKKMTSLFVFIIVLSIAFSFTFPANMLANEGTHNKVNLESPILNEKTLLDSSLDDGITTYAYPAPDVGSSFTYIGQVSKHSWTYTMSKEAIAYAIAGTPYRYIITRFLDDIWSWLLAGYEPTQYAKVFADGVQVSPYRFVTHFKYLWFEDSAFRTYKSTTTRTKIEDCSSYTPYCWKK